MATTHFEVVVIQGNVTAAQFQQWLAGTLPNTTTGNTIKTQLDATLLVDGVFVPTKIVPVKSETGMELGVPNARGNALGYSTTVDILPGRQYTVFVYPHTNTVPPSSMDQQKPRCW